MEMTMVFVIALKVWMIGVVLWLFVLSKAIHDLLHSDIHTTDRFIKVWDLMLSLLRILEKQQKQLEKQQQSDD